MKIKNYQKFNFRPRKFDEIFDYFHDLSDEFGLYYCNVPVRMNQMINSLEASDSNGCYYISPNTNKINIKIVFKESYLKENIDNILDYVEELENRLLDFKWHNYIDHTGEWVEYSIREVFNDWKHTIDKYLMVKNSAIGKRYLKDEKLTNRLSNELNLTCYVNYGN